MMDCKSALTEAGSLEDDHPAQADGVRHEEDSRATSGA
jgi:hypothetical protein